MSRTSGRCATAHVRTASGRLSRHPGGRAVVRRSRRAVPGEPVRAHDERSGRLAAEPRDPRAEEPGTRRGRRLRRRMAHGRPRSLDARSGASTTTESAPTSPAAKTSSNWTSLRATAGRSWHRSSVSACPRCPSPGSSEGWLGRAGNASSGGSEPSSGAIPRPRGRSSAEAVLVRLAHHRRPLRAVLLRRRAVPPPSEVDQRGALFAPAAAGA